MKRFACLAGLLLMSSLEAPAADGAREVYVYKADWRLGRAGTIRLDYLPATGDKPAAASLHLNSEGLVSRLYRVENHYSVTFDSGFCASATRMDAKEGKKHRLTEVTFHRIPGKAELLETDLLANRQVSAREIDIPPCVHDVVAGLGKLRTMSLAPGQTLYLPVSDGRKSVNARVDALAEETIRTSQGVFRSLRCEAHLFNNNLYRRRGRLFIWLSRDGRRIPVKILLDLPFYIGNVAIELEKIEKP